MRKYIVISIVLFCIILTTCTETPRQAKRKVLIDTDAGLDDIRALVLFLNSNDIEITGITTVEGLTRPDKGAMNILKILRYFKKPNIPVSIGLRNSDTEKLPDWKKAANEFWDVKMPPSQKIPYPASAPEFMYNKITETDDDITLICLGPLTNVADLIRRHPVIISRIKQLYFMGGDLNTDNLSWNVNLDREAAQIVLTSLPRIILTGESLSEPFPVNKVMDDSTVYSAGLTGKLFKRLHSSFFLKDKIKNGELYLWDELLSAVFLDSTLAEYSEFETGNLAIAETNFKFPSFIKPAGRNVLGVRKLDAIRTKQLLIDIWKRY